MGEAFEDVSSDRKVKNDGFDLHDPFHLGEEPVDEAGVASGDAGLRVTSRAPDRPDAVG